MENHRPTKKQTALLTFIREFLETNDYSPSYREIQSALGLRSVSAVAEHVNNCVELGFLRKVPGAARSIELVEPASQPAYILEIKHAITLLDDHPEDQAILRQALQILTRNKELNLS